MHGIKKITSAWILNIIGTKIYQSLGFTAEPRPSSLGNNNLFICQCIQAWVIPYRIYKKRALLEVTFSDFDEIWHDCRPI